MQLSVKTGFSSNSSACIRPASRRAGFSLPEVMVAMVVISLVCMAIFSGMYLVSRLALNNAVRSEGFRLMQAEAERLTSLDFFSVGASADQLITSCVTTSFRSNKESRFDYPSESDGRITYTRRVVDVATTTTSKNLRVEVQWTWQRRTNLISVPVLRYQ